VDGLQLIGVPYRNATQNAQLASVLREIGLDRDRYPRKLKGDFIGEIWLEIY
jgi:hypothetical protein